MKELKNKLAEYFGISNETLLGMMLQYGFTGEHLAKAEQHGLIKLPEGDESIVTKTFNTYQFIDGEIFGDDRMHARDLKDLARLCGIIKPIFEPGTNGETHIYEKERFSGNKTFVITTKKIEKK